MSLHRTEDLYQRKVRRFKIFFLFSILIVIFCIVASFVSGLRAISASDNLSRKLKTIHTLDLALSAAKDAETGQRGYQITHNQDYLQPYLDSKTEIYRHLDDLKDLKASGELTQVDIVSILEHVKFLIAYLDTLVASERAFENKARIDSFDLDEAKRKMDQVRAEILLAHQTSELEFADALKVAGSAQQSWKILFFLTFAICLIFFAWLFLRISKLDKDSSDTLLALAKEKERLHYAESELVEAQRISQVGSWFWNAETDQLSGSPQLFRIYGLDPQKEKFLNFNQQRETYYPIDDWEKLNAALQETLKSGEGFRLEIGAFRNKFPIWLAVRGEIVKNSEGKFLGLRGTVEDITERKNAEEALENSERLYRAIGESIDYGIWICDEWGNNTYTSDSLLKLAGVGREGCTEYNWATLLHPDDAQKTIEDWKNCVKHGGKWYKEHRFKGADGQWHPILACGVPVKDQNGKITCWAGINLDISHLKRAQQTLIDLVAEREELLLREKEARASAESANQAKDEFIARLSHELRTPLTPVLAAAQMLEREEKLNPQLQNYIDIIKRNLKLEARLIDDLLDLNRIVRGKLHLKFQETDLHFLIETSLETCSASITEKQIQLDLNLKAKLTTVHADPSRLQQVLCNLISNAVKFSPFAEKICISTLNSEDGWIEMRLIDHGKGIAPAELPTLFSAFEQGDASTSREFGGLGLGLAISKSLCRMHGGSIEAFSEGVGKGATFTLRLPLIIPSGKKPEQVPALIKAQSLMILLVEDHEDTSELLKAFLLSLGHQVHCAGTVSEAISAASTHKFQLLLCDLGLPDGSGLEVMSAIKEQKLIEKAVAMTGFGMEKDIEACKLAGFNAHFTKPVDLEQLERLINQIDDLG